VFVDSQTAIIGAVAGYLSLWLVFHLFRLLTGKEGMGRGDFKLLALFGAWLGWQSLPQILLLSTIPGALFGIALIASGRSERKRPSPSAPSWPSPAGSAWSGAMPSRRPTCAGAARLSRLTVALTGGIGSGKSTVSALFAQRSASTSSTPTRSPTR
jgi:Flp pilus assembly protein protease CpaA